MRSMRPGGWGWVGLAGYIAVCDAILLRRRHATLSEVFGDALVHPLRRVPVVTVWAILTVHLFAALMPADLRRRWGRFDPIGQLARLIEAKG